MGNSTDEQNISAHPQSLSAESVVNVSTGISFDTPQDLSRTTPPYKFLQIGWDEAQGSLPWCMTGIEDIQYEKAYTIYSH